MKQSKQLKNKRAKIARGLKLSYFKLVALKRQNNTPLVISKNGEIKELDPHEVQLSGEHPDKQKGEQ